MGYSWIKIIQIICNFQNDLNAIPLRRYQSRLRKVLRSQRPTFGRYLSGRSWIFFAAAKKGINYLAFRIVCAPGNLKLRINSVFVDFTTVQHSDQGCIVTTFSLNLAAFAAQLNTFSFSLTKMNRDTLLFPCVDVHKALQFVWHFKAFSS